MKRLVVFLTLVCALATALLLTASPAAAHCVQTPVGYADLAPGHFAAAGAHEAAIAHSGGVGSAVQWDGAEREGSGQQPRLDAH